MPPPLVHHQPEITASNDADLVRLLVNRDEQHLIIVRRVKPPKRLIATWAAARADVVVDQTID